MIPTINSLLEIYRYYLWSHNTGSNFNFEIEIASFFFQRLYANVFFLSVKSESSTWTSSIKNPFKHTITKHFNQPKISTRYSLVWLSNYSPPLDTLQSELHSNRPEILHNHRGGQEPEPPGRKLDFFSSLRRFPLGSFISEINLRLQRPSWPDREQAISDGWTRSIYLPAQARVNRFPRNTGSSRGSAKSVRPLEQGFCGCSTRSVSW